MDIEKTLLEVGLSQNEMKIYLALLRMGSGRVGEIYKEAKINRANSYQAIQRLIEKGLVSYIIEAGRKVFKPVNPKRFVELIEEKKNSIEKIIPELEVMFNKTKTKYSITVFKGIKGIKSVFHDVLREGKDYFVIGSSENFFSQKMPYFLKNFRKRKVETKIKTKIIERIGRDTIKRKRGKLTEVKFASYKFESSTETIIYGNKIGIILWHKEIPEAIIIEDELTAKTYRTYFDLLWKISKTKEQAEKLI